jgi:hypothetical protein
MTEERVNFSPLSPDDEAIERMVRNIAWRTRAELARRAAQRLSVVELIAAWARPAIMIAASIAGISVTLLAWFDGSRAEAATGAYMPASEVPPTAVSWYEEDRDPTVEDLLVVSTQER